MRDDYEVFEYEYEEKEESWTTSAVTGGLFMIACTVWAILIAAI